nr:MAG TPA: NikA, BACTERIAL CONJUGATION, RELAXASE, DNA [Caudoviricetes sp.]
MSPRTGRPKLQNPINHQITVRLTGEMMKRLADYCKKHEITKGEAVRKGVEKLLDE